MIHVHLTHINPEGRRLFAIMDAPAYGTLDDVFRGLIDDKFILGDKILGRLVDGQFVQEGSEPVIYAASSVYSIAKHMPSSKAVAS